jgi:hypothetical protein
MSFSPAISDDGRYVAFLSWASTLVVPDEKNCPDEPDVISACQDAFVHDRKTGKTVRVSVSSSGARGNQGTSSVGISGDGHVAVFSSYAGNLVRDPTPGCEHAFQDRCADAFVHDLRTGTTERVSLDEKGREFPDGLSWPPPVVSRDGSIVAFAALIVTKQPGELGGGTSRSYVYVRDRVRKRTTALPQELGGRPLEFSDDGRTVVTMDSFDDRDTISTYDLETRSVTTVLDRSDVADDFRVVSVTPDAKYLLLETGATAGFEPIPPGKLLLFDASNRRFQLVTRLNKEESFGPFAEPQALSSGAQLIVFSTDMATLVPGDTNNVWDVFLWDRATKTFSRVSER